jgi:hypothetical protein
VACNCTVEISDARADVQSDITIVRSDVVVGQSDHSSVQSDVIVVQNRFATIKSNLTVLISDIAVFAEARNLQLNEFTKSNA